MSEETTFSFPPKGHVAILAYDSANDRWQAVYVDASGNLQVDIAAAEQLECLAHQYDGASWQKSNLLFGYNAQWAEQATVAGTGGAADYAETGTVPEGYIYIPQVVGAFHNDTTNRSVSIIYNANAIPVYTKYETNVAISAVVLSPYACPLLEGDKIMAGFYSLASGKTGYLRVIGYKMKLDM